MSRNQHDHRAPSDSFGVLRMLRSAIPLHARKAPGSKALLALLAAVLCCGLFTPAKAESLNLLYYGNSFMLGYESIRTIPEVVSELAVAAGYAAPNTLNVSEDGVDLAYHLSFENEDVYTHLDPGETWDFMILQDHSTMPTHIGDLNSMRTSALGLYQYVAADNPNVIPVLFETWARAPGYYFYTDPVPFFPGGAAQMQQEVRDGYLATQSDINAYVGTDLARLAPVGTVFEGTGFDASLYAWDQWHIGNLGTLVAALVTYSAIYGEPPVGQFDISSVLESLELTAEEGQFALNIVGFPVPEPSSLVLGVLAALGLAWRWRSLARR